MVEVLVDHAKCTKQFVQIAVKNVKSHSNLLKEDRFIVKNVILNTALGNSRAIDSLP